jgi:hypothetical protein
MEGRTQHERVEGEVSGVVRGLTPAVGALGGVAEGAWWSGGERRESAKEQAWEVPQDRRDTERRAQYGCRNGEVERAARWER